MYSIPVYFLLPIDKVGSMVYTVINQEVQWVK